MKLSMLLSSRSDEYPILQCHNGDDRHVHVHEKVYKVKDEFDRRLADILIEDM